MTARDDTRSESVNTDPTLAAPTDAQQIVQTLANADRPVRLDVLGSRVGLTRPVLKAVLRDLEAEDVVDVHQRWDDVRVALVDTELVATSGGAS